MEKETWHIQDIIDLEYFLTMDEKEEGVSGGRAQMKRDRDIYLKHIRPMESEGQPPAPGQAIRIWLEGRRNMEKLEQGTGRFFPGETFEEMHRLLRYAMLIIGFMAGTGLAFSFLNYQGTQPLNVASYLGGFVFTQLLLLIIFLLLYLIRSWNGYPLRSSIIFTLFSGLLGKLIRRLKRESLKLLSGSRRDSLEAIVGLIQGKRRAYGRLFYWPVFLLSQTFMIALNLGLLGATLLKVAGADIAFGWQSTIQFSAGFVFDLVEIIALPWSWFMPAGIAHPTLAQIEGSHMVLKEGIYRLATSDLVSWWPFLCLSLVFYGLLPRIILFVLGLIAEKRGLSRIDFSHHACARLYNRMRTPMVETEGGFHERTSVSMDGADRSEAPTHHHGIRTGGKVIALIPEDIYDSCPLDELHRIVRERTGAGILDVIPFREEDGTDLALLIRKKESHDILLLQEAWQPPIREFLFFLRDLRRAVGESSRIIVGLIGRPGGERGFFAPVRKDEFTAWDRKIQSLQDPLLDLERLETDAK